MDVIVGDAGVEEVLTVKHIKDGVVALAVCGVVVSRRKKNAHGASVIEDRAVQIKGFNLADNGGRTFFRSLGLGGGLNTGQGEYEQGGPFQGHAESPEADSIERKWQPANEGVGRVAPRAQEHRQIPSLRSKP